MLYLEHISLTLGDRKLLRDVNAVINPGERIGLVGPNGAGKSTLLKIIAGIIEPDDGTVNKAGETTVGYLPQDGVEPDPTLTVYEEVETIYSELLELQEKTERAQHRLAELPHDSEEHEKALQHYGELQHRLEESGIYTMRSDIEKTLEGLGFGQEDFHRPTTEFSGGWLMRIALAKLLLKRPSVLLLDEPTNHLDIESLQWIENFLKSYKGALLLVSHDRAFLDQVCTRTLAIHSSTLEDYAGNYSYYEKEREKRLEQLRNAYKNQQKEIQDIQQFIDRFRYQANKASQVQSRIKQLEKMDVIELEDEQEEIQFDFPEPERSGVVVMELEDVRKSYDDNVVFESLDYRIERGDRIAIVGPNGAGKSTMARILAGIEPFDAGDRKPGHNVEVSYFAQHQAEELDLDSTPLDIMRTTAGHDSETRLRTLLGCFLFQGDDVFKQVSVLSGGEKSRLALARMLIRPANFLIFDEPTNHLDMRSKNMLQQALEHYSGSYAIVSHDRAFLDPIVDKVIEVQPHRIRTYLGNVSYYLDKKREEREGEAQQAEEQRKENGQQPMSRKEQRRMEAELRQQKYKKLKPLQKQMKPVEEQVEQLEARKTEIEAMMAEPDFYDDSDRVQEISVEYDRIKAELDKVYQRWEELAEKMSRIEAEFAP